jgi:hypothetical protein
MSTRSVGLDVKVVVVFALLLLLVAPVPSLCACCCCCTELLLHDDVVKGRYKDRLVLLLRLLDCEAADFGRTATKDNSELLVKKTHWLGADSPGGGTEATFSGDKKAGGVLGVVVVVAAADVVVVVVILVVEFTCRSMVLPEPKRGG